MIRYWAISRHELVEHNGFVNFATCETCDKTQIEMREKNVRHKSHDQTSQFAVSLFGHGWSNNKHCCDFFLAILVCANSNRTTGSRREQAKQIDWSVSIDVSDKHFNFMDFLFINHKVIACGTWKCINIFHISQLISIIFRVKVRRVFIVNIFTSHFFTTLKIFQSKSTKNSISQHHKA